MTCHFILYVRDQASSTAFYEKALALSPALNVPGMTEFHLAENVVLGLMPEKGIVKLLEGAIENPAEASGIPRSEVYLRVSEPEVYFERAVAAGAKVLSPI